MNENGTREITNARQRRFILALLEAPTVREAAAAAGIGETTAWRYLGAPAVRAELGRRTDGMLTQAAVGVLDDMGQARAVLRGVMADTEAPDGVRVSAARAVLDAGLRLFELVSLSERVAELERLAAAVAGGG